MAAQDCCLYCGHKRNHITSDENNKMWSIIRIVNNFSTKVLVSSSQRESQQLQSVIVLYQVYYIFRMQIKMVPGVSCAQNRLLTVYRFTLSHCPWVSLFGVDLVDVEFLNRHVSKMQCSVFVTCSRLPHRKWLLCCMVTNLFRWCWQSSQPLLLQYLEHRGVNMWAVSFFGESRQTSHSQTDKTMSLFCQD